MCRTKKRGKKAFGLLFSLLCTAVLLLHKDGAQFLNIAWLALACFAVSRVTLPSPAMAYLLSMPLSNYTNVSRNRRHTGCLVKNAPKHIRQMTKSVKTSHEQTLKSHGMKSTNGAALVDSRGHKCKKKKVYERSSQMLSQQEPIKNQKQNHFKHCLDYKNTFSYFFKISKNVQHQGFFSPFLFLQSHASTCIFIIIITLI